MLGRGVGILITPEREEEIMRFYKVTTHSESEGSGGFKFFTSKACAKSYAKDWESRSERVQPPLSSAGVPYWDEQSSS